jgi:hypothetical protein
MNNPVTSVKETDGESPAPSKSLCLLHVYVYPSIYRWTCSFISIYGFVALSLYAVWMCIFLYMDVYLYLYMDVYHSIFL